MDVLVVCSNYPDHASEGFKSFISVESCNQPSFLGSNGVPLFGNGCTFRYVCELGYQPIGGVSSSIKCTNGFWSARAVCIKQVIYFKMVFNFFFKFNIFLLKEITNTNRMLNAASQTQNSNQNNLNRLAPSSSPSIIIPGSNNQNTFIKRSDSQEISTNSKDFIRVKRSSDDSENENDKESQELVKIDLTEDDSEQSRSYLKEIFGPAILENENLSDKSPKDLIELNNQLFDFNNTTEQENNAESILTTPLTSTTTEESIIETTKDQDNDDNDISFSTTEIIDQTTLEETEEPQTTTEEEESTSTEETTKDRKLFLDKMIESIQTSTIETTTISEESNLEPNLEEINENETTIETTTIMQRTKPKKHTKKLEKEILKENKFEDSKEIENNNKETISDPSIDWSAFMNSDSEKTIYESFYELLDNGIGDGFLNLGENQNLNFDNFDNIKNKKKILDLIEPI